MASASFLPLLLLLLLVTLAAADLRFITKNCNRADNNPSACIAMLQEDRRATNATTLLDLTYFALDITSADGFATVARIQQIADANPGTPLEEAMNMCAQVYGEFADSFKDARDSVGSHAYADAQEAIGYITVVNAPDDCDRAVADRGLRSPLAQRAKMARDGHDVCSGLLDLLSGDSI